MSRLPSRPKLSRFLQLCSRAGGETFGAKVWRHSGFDLMLWDLQDVFFLIKAESRISASSDVHTFMKGKMERLSWLCIKLGLACIYDKQFSQTPPVDTVGLLLVLSMFVSWRGRRPACRPTSADPR